MRKPSRTMPPTPNPPMTSLGILVLSLFGVGLMISLSLYPNLLLPLGAILVATVILTLIDRRRLSRLAADRPGESICTFARSFDRRTVDTWILRAVFEELQPYCAFGRRVLPLRRTDDLHDDLRIDPEDLEDLGADIAYRTGRSLEESDQNPLFGNVKTVSDLVIFFTKQPRRPM